MRYQFYREHKYVSFALNDLERLIATTDFRDKTQAKHIMQELTSIKHMLYGHAQYENNKLHALLKEKGSTLYKHAEEDHEHHEKQFELLEHLLAELMNAKTENTQLDLGYQFYLNYRKFVGDNLLHLHEEETMILPELQKFYTDDELRAVEFDTYQRMTTEEMIHMMQVLFPHMNPTDKEAFLRDIKESQPEKFVHAWEGIKVDFKPHEKQQIAANLKIKSS